MEITEIKKKIRQEMFARRAQLEVPEKAKYDHWAYQSAWELINQHNFKTIHCYLPMGTEINIFPLIEKMLIENRTVICPKTLPKRKLQNLVLNSLDELEKGLFGTRHPANTEAFSGKYDLIIVPGLAFDKSNFRLGYGGGYYDTFMINHPNAYKLGIFYPFQEIEQVPVEPHDLKLDEILVSSDFSI